MDKTVDDLKVVVLAAGKGQRLQQNEEADLPKVLRTVAGRPLMGWVLDHISFVAPENITIVVGFQAEQVKAAFGPAYNYAWQKEQLGTGHAVAAAEESLAGFCGDVLVIYGDMPLVEPQTYKRLIKRHQENKAACTLLTVYSERLPDYGRIIRDHKGRFIGIVEERDCTPEQLLIREVNPGVYVFKAAELFRTLVQIKNNNIQGEYYLTDVPLLLLEAGDTVDTVMIEDDVQVLGVNTLKDLERCALALGGQQR